MPVDAVPWNTYSSADPNPTYNIAFYHKATRELLINKITCRIWNVVAGQQVTVRIFKTTKNTSVFNPANLLGTDILVNTFVFDGDFNTNPFRDHEIFLDTLLLLQLNEWIYVDFYTSIGSLVVYQTGTGNPIIYQRELRINGGGIFYDSTGWRNTGLNLFNVSKENDRRVSRLENPDLDLLLPTEVKVPVGVEFNLWKDSFLPIPDDQEDYHVSFRNLTYNFEATVDNSGIVITPRCLRYKPLSMFPTQKIGVYINDFKGNVKQFKELSITSISRNAGAGVKNVVLCGDSKLEYLAGETARELAVLSASATGATFNLIGTKLENDGVRHEGYAGRTINYFLGNTSPFFRGGELDFQQYAIDQGVNTIHAFHLQLGANDIFQGIRQNMTSTNISTINAFKLFVDVLLSAGKGFPDCKVLIALQDLGGNSSVSPSSRPTSKYKLELHRLNMLLLKEFEGGRYHENVDINPTHLWIDRTYSYPHSEYPASLRANATDTVLLQSDYIHQNIEGSRQYADAIFSKLKSVF